MTKIKLLLIIILTSNQLFAQHEIWGTVSNGGNGNNGYIFKTDSIGENFQIVHYFDSINGTSPGALLVASDNKLYGVTSAGGINNQGLFSGGVFYEYDLTTSTFTALQHFGPNNTQITGVRPAGDGLRTLTEVSPGIIYGQIRGAYQGGTVFSFNTATQTITTALTLPTFQGGASNSTLGNRLEGNLYKAPDGFLYGTTYTNSQCPIPNPNFGSIVRIDPVTHAFSIRYLCPCNGNSGFQFDNDFVSYDNKLYSVTKLGGANSKGVIYSFDPATSTYTNKYNFQGNILGFQPSTLVKASNGKFYGTAYGGTPEQGFPSGGGILFEFDPVTDQFTKKLDFVYGNGHYLNVGPFPFSLINGNNGKLYGATSNGVFEYNLTLNQTIAKSRFPIGMGWYSPATPSLTAVCRKPSYTPINDTNVILCKDSDFSYDLTSDNTTSLIWKHDGIITPLQTSPVLSLTDVGVNDTGIWAAELTNVCGTTITHNIHIDLIPQVSVIQNDNSLEVTSGGDSYQWINCTTELPINGENSVTYTANQNGSFAVEVTNGVCIDTSDCFSVALSINENLANNSISLYPNPASEILYLTGNNQIQSIDIYDAFGQVVLTRKNEQKIDISILAKGLYFVATQTETGVWNTKFLKE